MSNGNGKPASKPQRQPSQAERLAKDNLRMPPFDTQAEVGVLGSMILSIDACDEAVILLLAEDFYDTAHQIIFTALKALHNKGKPADTSLLIDLLKKENNFETVGGTGYLSKIINGVPNAAHNRYYCELVHGYSLQRQTIKASTETLAEAYEKTDNPMGVVERAESRMFEVMERGLENDAPVTSLMDVLVAASERMEARHHGQHVSGVRFGLGYLDSLLGGLKDGEMTIIAGRPSNGKTSLGIGLALFAAHHDQLPTLFVSLEMSKLELADRMLTMFAEIDAWRMQKGHLTQEERQHILATVGNLGTAPLHVEDSPSRTVTQIAALARRHKRKHGLKLLIIDYVQLIEPDDEKMQREQQVAKMARRLKILARELKVPVVILAQVNRKSDERGQNECPRLSQLRESGALEQDADVVIFVHRPAVADIEQQVPAMQGEPCKIVIAKQRNGPVGETEAFFYRGYSAFKAHAHDDAGTGQQWGDDGPPVPTGASGASHGHGTHPTHGPSF